MAPQLALPRNFEVATNCLGEFHMGAVGHGISVTCPKGRFMALWSTIVLVTSDNFDPPKVPTDLSTDSRFLVIAGEFASYVLDLEAVAISLYRATVRDSEGIWCDETPISGNDVVHFNGKSGKHYYVQFPFIGEPKFNEYWAAYEKRRLGQIRELREGAI
ncbi:MAG: hypothetical protein WA190_00175 [Usitatibacter sp.]